MDLFLFQKMNQYVTKWVWLDAFGIFLAKYFEYFLILFLLSFLVANFKKYWRMIILASVSAVLARLLFVEIFHWLLPRMRPFVENQVNLLFSQPPTPSFPSGHAAFYFALSMAVFLHFKKIKPKFWLIINMGFFVSSFLISLARVFAGIHWPSDILAGAIVGIFSGWLVTILLRKFS